MVELHKKPFEKKKKISIDINEEMLGTIDDLAKLTHANRSQIITSLFGSGLYPLFRQIEGSWFAMLTSSKDDKMKKIIKDLLEGLNKIENASGIHDLDRKEKEINKILKGRKSKANISRA